MFDMEVLFSILRWAHIILGFIGLVFFWVPVFTRKGGAQHKFYGRVFKYCAYGVLFSAMLSVIARVFIALSSGVTPISHPQNYAFLVFLGYLAIVTYILMRHGFLVLNYKKSLAGMNNTHNWFWALCALFSSLFIIAYGLYFSPPNKILLFALSPLGFLTGLGILKVIKATEQENKEWFYEHMGAILGTGIAFHTAFAVFGSIQLFGFQSSGPSAVIPWVAPTIVGVPAIIIWTRYYRNKFSVPGIKK